ncbi:nicotinate-nucleotide adenylyltransferase [Mycoplasmopsis canis]|uniref:nicotinate-nucleotide adenylyltransferase n=1 Tax=Mycoplasmopsis cynos TaxID=171284 RepID=UPI002B001B91|nr:nicotinate-nucleotide adenylyltransferase [Mycoplasmopsis cynos]WQQ13315.1 nicotinate-nucleotide adenylyltransferase [Mycoplasmopsis cynos]WQQ13591.1 nicotinate-nucleotide adenylyltransferase [Mycoplasmopsis cynos]
MRIGIYGGSFDPIHKGHIKLAKYAIKALNLDKLLIIPAYVSPFKNKGISIEDKINMIELVLEQKMELCLFEAKRNTVSYTIDTIKYLKNKYPNDELFLIIGSDNLPKLHKWKDVDQIFSLSNLVVLKRTKNISKTNLKKYHGILMDNPIIDYSSTMVRNGMFQMLDPKVVDYIQSKGLYLEKIIHASLSALRAKHCVSCASFAADLAKKHNYPAKDAYIAGLIHDIAREWDPKFSRDFIKKYQPDLNNVPDYFLHQHCGALWAEYIYGLKNKEIIQAIKCHTSMRTNMNKLDKILFIADKICQGRKFNGIQKVRELAFNDLDAGFAKVTRCTYDWNTKINKVVFEKEIEEIYQKYMEK